MLLEFQRVRVKMETWKHLSLQKLSKSIKKLCLLNVTMFVFLSRIKSAQIFLICRSVGIAAIFKRRNRDLNFADSACSEGLKGELHFSVFGFPWKWGDMCP